ncbi:MAG: glycosyltransferase family 4 protein [Muribaculaceae bacterium]|nr:glycosyltransferase family 4 protein [Muribaculaceae bacterium]
MKIVVVGTRGIPRIQGGVETHCEALCPRLVEMGCDVTVIRRSCYVADDNRITEYKGVKLVDVFAPRRKSLEAIVHTFLAVIKARRLHADVVHIHAIGPGLCAPLARLLGMRVVATNHGPDYNRQKWGWFAKTMLKMGEWCQAHCAHQIVVISHVIENILKDRYNRVKGVNLIYNGVETPQKSTSTSYLDELGLTPKKYVIAVARFVPEKRLDYLIEAFGKAANAEGYKLVLVGDSDYPDDYSDKLKKQAAEAGVVMTGFIRDEKLNQIMTNAALFVLPSTHEGLPISLLEAMAYGIDVIVSNIDANRLPELCDDDIFEVDNIEALTQTLDRKLAAPQLGRKYDLTKYNWDFIAQQTLEVYTKALKKKKD